MPMPVRRYTVDEVDAIPDDGNRHEVLYGVLHVTPAPRRPHQVVATRLAALLSKFLEPEPDAVVCATGGVVVRPDVKLEPDVLVSQEPTTGTTWEDVRTHWLAVEISGRGSRLYDRNHKRQAYLDLGIAEVWLVDLAERQVDISSRGNPLERTERRTVAWRSPAGRVLTLDLGELFRGIPPGDW